MSLSIVAPGTQAAPISLSHHEQLQRLNITSASGIGSRKIAAAGPVDLSFDALGRSFELQLTPNNRLLAVARDIAGIDVIPYQGKLAGNEESWVRIVLSDGAPSGLIWDGSELFAIERPGNNAAGTDSTIIYRLADAFIEPGSMTCGAGGELTSGSTVFKSLSGELQAASARAPGAVSQIDIGIVADAEFYARHGDNSGQAIIDRMNLVDGYFSAQTGIQINWPLVQVFSNSESPSYPFTDTVRVGLEPQNNPDDLLVQLADYRNSNPNQHANGLTHLWTGKDVEGANNNTSTVGIAYTGALCRQRVGAGLSEGRSNPTFDSLVAAHEIGHNFGAPHDGTQGSACESVDTSTNDYLMEPSLTNSSEFSQCSLDQMADDIANASCITPLPSVDMGIGIEDPSPQELLGNTATISFDLINSGTLPAPDVLAEFTIPANVSLVATAASLGNCVDGGGVVSCSIGEVAGGAAVSVVLTSDTTSIGPGNFTASVTTVDDANLADNQGSVTLTVQPAVNLSITPPSTRQLGIDQSTGLTALLENSSILDATGVTLSISLSSGLRVDSASWPLGTCTVSNSQVDCEGATFTALSNTTLSLGVTAITEGTKTLNFSMASAEAEADPGNNTASATVNVSAPQEDSGGGGAGLWLLPLLGLLATRRRGID